MRYARPKAYTLTYKSKTITVDKAVRDRLGKLPAVSNDYINTPVECGTIKGNKKFTLSTQAEIASFKLDLIALGKKLAPAITKAKAKDKIDQARWAAESKKREEARYSAHKRELAATVAANPLPMGIKTSDLLNPGYKRSVTIASLGGKIPGTRAGEFGGASSFEIWNTTGFGWCIPTLSINQTVRAGSYRTYAVQISTGKLVSIGHGPHVNAKLRVYFTKANKKRLEKAVGSIIDSGSMAANEYRDTIFSRRARGSLRRRSWL